MNWRPASLSAGSVGRSNLRGRFDGNYILDGLLIERLETLGVAVERLTELVSFKDEGGCLTARLRGQAGTEEVCEATYVAGCDGARSIVRETIGTGFPGGTYRQLFYVADVHAEGPSIDGELHVDLDEADFLAVFPLAGEGRARLIGTVRDERADHPDTLKFEDVSGRAMQSLNVRVRRVNWFSTYHVHHRVTEHFRKGRAFLLGDAAHIHSPAGGQGMNTGIGDAINLAWKLATILGGSAPDSLLDSFEAERIGFARRLVATTDRAFSFATAEGAMADILRTRVAPLLIPTITVFKAAREFLFRTVAQFTLNYRGGPLSVGKAGASMAAIGCRGYQPMARTTSWASKPCVGKFMSMGPLPQTSSRGAPLRTRRCMCSTGDRSMRRPALPAMPSICFDPTVTSR